MSRNVVVTGANGFIGRHVARYFSIKGWHVSGLGHGDWSTEELSSYGLDSWHSDEITTDTLKLCDNNPDVIVHCAGGSSVGFSVDNPDEDFKRTVDSTTQILEFIRHYSPDTSLIYPSSAAVYGDTKSNPISEDDALNPVSPYGKHKKIVEENIKIYCSDYSLKASIVRLFSVYGNELKKQLLWDACEKISKGIINFDGTGDEIRDWLNVKDAAMLIYQLTNHANSKCTIVNGASGVGTTNHNLLRMLFNQLGRDDNPVFTGVNRPGDPTCYIADISRAWAIDWQPRIDLESGIHEYVDWFNSKHNNSASD